MRIVKLNEDAKKNILADLLKRDPNNYDQYAESVNAIVEDVKKRKDQALFEYTKKFDKADLNSNNIRVTEEEIQFYQNEIISNIWYPYTNELVEQSQRNAWFRNLVEQFLNGQLEENMFVMQLEKRIRMMQMEGGII